MVLHPLWRGRHVLKDHANAYHVAAPGIPARLESTGSELQKKAPYALRLLDGEMKSPLALTLERRREFPAASGSSFR
jgi:hypothetical protein